MAVWKVNTILCGASSAGKTTLANDLIEKYSGFCFIKEVARNLMKIQNISNADLNKSLHSDKKLFMDLQSSILKCQCLQERDMIEQQKIIISDRGPDSIIFGSHYIDEAFASELANSAYGKECLKRYHQFLVVLVNPLSTNDIDGVRLVLKSEKDKISFTEYFRTLFRRHGISYLDLTNSDRNERVKQLEQTVFRDALLEFDCSQAVHVGRLSLPNLCQSCHPQSLAIPTLILAEDNIQQRMTTFPDSISRIVDRYGIDNFLLVEFSPKMSARLVHQILLKGILFGGEEFNFFGCSSSGLKKRKCYMWKGSIDDCHQILAESGDFESIKTVSKRIARISLLFSAVRLTFPIEDSQIVNIPDVERGGCNFTDGCGLIGCELARKITDHAITEPPKTIPSVFQIRLQGYKGVVVKDRHLPGNALHLRDSMRKFNTTSYPVLGVAGYSQPYTFGHLNQQFIMLLSGLGIPDEVFLTKQQEHFDRLTNMFQTRQDAFEVLMWRKEFSLAQEALTCSDFASNSNIQSALRKLRNKLLDQADRLRLLVPQSRNVYGVCDTYGILKYGQCFCRPTIRGEPVTVRGLVVVCKNPCYLLGDVRVLRAVSSVDDPRISQMEKDLVDCLVFPTDGPRPHADEIAGSDLDGDMFFICWDQTLIPNSPRPAYGYPAAASKRSIAITRESLIAYFANQNRTQQMVGKIDTFYKKWASRKGVNSVECESLGQLFSRAIDSAKSGEAINIPPHLQPPVLGEDIQSKFVWERMHDAAAKEKEDIRERVVASKAVNDVTIDFVWGLVTDPETCVNEFEIFEFICAWLPDDADRRHVLLELCEYVDFGRFSVDEMEIAVARGVPRALVMNALNKSHLMTAEMRQDFAQHLSDYRWRFYWSGRHTDFEWGILTKVLTTFKQSLIVLSLNDGVTFAFHFLQRCKLGKQPIKGNSVAVYFWSSHFGYRFRYILNEGYSLNLEDGIFQLYHGELVNTFIWLKFECIDKTKPNRRSGSLVIDGTQFDRISVDITRFKSNILTGEQRHPLVRKSNFSALEIFVQDGNKDRNFFDSLDVNDLICAAPDEEDGQSSDEDDDDFDADEHLETSEVTEENFHDFLETSAEGGNASSFLQVLQLGLEISLEVPRDSLELLEILLIRMLRKYRHRSLSPDIVSTAESLLGILGAAVKASTHTRFLSFVKLLSHPSLEHLSSQLLQGRIAERSSQDTLSVDSFLGVMSDWELWSEFPESISYKVLKWAHAVCEDAILPAVQPVNDDHVSSLAATPPSENNELWPDYVIKLARLQAYGFIQEVAQTRERLATQQDRRLDGHFGPFRISPCQQEDNNNELEPRDKKDVSKSQVVFYSTGTLELSALWPSQWVAVSRVRDQEVSHSDGQRLGWDARCCFGQITQFSVAPPNITVQIKRPFPFVLSACLDGRKNWRWVLDVVGNIVSFERTMRALQQITDDDRDRTIPLLPILIHPIDFSGSEKNSIVQKSSKSLRVDRISSSSLNESQLTAIQSALSQRVTLVHGPPGTGKTHVGCEIIRQASERNGNSKVLVIAETNVAVDNIARKLWNESTLRIVRVGNPGQIASDLYDLSLDGQMEKNAISRGKRTHYRDLLGRMTRDNKLADKIVKSTEVACTTCAGAGDFALSGVIFDFLLVDEATQATEPSCLPALVRGCRQLVLIGDPQQLPPFALKAPPSDLKLPDISRTLFHRLSEAIEPVFLDTQHRMHPSLAEFPSRYFYEGKLKSGVSAKDRLPPEFSWPDRKRPLCIINTDSSESRSGSSFKNVEEADLVCRVVDKLLFGGLSPLDIGVLTPYVGQVREIEHRLADRGFDHMMVKSIDGFQGREKEVIVFSTVRSNNYGKLGFTDDPKRVNVLLTRCKRGLIGVGNISTLSSSEMWTAWINQAPHMDNSLSNDSLSSERKPLDHRTRNKFSASARGCCRKPRVTTRPAHHRRK